MSTLFDGHFADGSPLPPLPPAYDDEPSEGARPGVRLLVDPGTLLEGLNPSQRAEEIAR